LFSRLERAAWARCIRRGTQKLGRDVAIKVLPESLNTDPNRVARFDREARLLASLNHPNIASLYAVG
jgi:serine/threonine protein kinase